MTTSYMGQFLKIDLTRGRVETMPVDPDLQRRFIGGKGVGARLLYDLAPPQCDPLGPDNPLLFMTGPLTGTRAPAMRGCVITKSPLTGTFLDSYFGGHFSPEIKYAGYDGLIFTGRSETPVYLWIDDDRVEIRDAAHLEGKDTFETNHALKAELADPTVKVACIGPAGERAIRYALIACEYNRQAGRGGAGAVMGSKGLKAIAIRGTRSVQVADRTAFNAAVKTACSQLNEETTGAFTLDGTAGSIPFANETGLLPVRNYRDGVFGGAEGLGPEAQREKLWQRDLACAGCPIRCSKMGKIRTGKYAGIVSDAVEYELLGLLGSNLGISDIRAVTHLAHQCDAIGIDGMSAGGAIGFAMELFEKGVIGPEDTGGVDLAFGSVAAADHLLDAIALRKGRLGHLLGEGVRRAAEALGGDAPDMAVHIKGLEYPAWGPRGVPGMALATATADRGGCHQRAFPILNEVEGRWKGEPITQLGLEKKAAIVVEQQNDLAALDTLVKCDFAQYGIERPTYLDLLAAAAGRRLSVEDLNILGERVWNQVRLFNIREGFSRKEDAIPKRFMTDPLPSGPRAGHRITPADMDRLVSDYYALRGWDENGKPRPETLERLGLAEA